MNDVTKNISLPESWQHASMQIAQLFSNLPLKTHAALLVILPEEEAYDSLRMAANALALQVVAMPTHSAQEGVAKAIAQTQPSIVVCAPEVFGWVSKLAFLGGCLAIYTCGDDGEGTLLDRASHCSSLCPATTSGLTVPALLKLDANGSPIASL